jgi:hypothetical protein
MKHFYIFYIDDGKNFYERTCGSKKSADERVEYLKTIYKDAIWFNDIPKDYNYFY